MTTENAPQGASKSSSTRTGRWTPAEHAVFLKGMRLHPKQWKKIAEMVQTRTVVQVRTHAQKCWNGNVDGETPLTAIGTHLGECETPARESPKKKAKTAEKVFFSHHRVMATELDIGRQLDMQGSTLDLITGDLIPDDFLKHGLPFADLGPTTPSSKLSKDLSTMALSPHINKSGIQSLLCNAPEHWENASNLSASTETTASSIDDIFW